MVEFDDLKDSDFDVVAQELEDIARLEKEYQETHDTQCLIQIARRYNALAEVFLETEESYTSEYFEYKKKAAEYFTKIWDSTDQPNALLFASLFYECANEHGKAAECLKIIKNSKGTGDVSFFLDNEVLKVVDSLINGPIKKAEKMVESKSEDIDYMVAKEIKNTLQFLQYKQEIKEKSQDKTKNKDKNKNSTKFDDSSNKKRWKIKLKDK